MKKLMNLSKLAIAALITSGLFVACSEEISENTVDTQYAAQTGNLGNAGQAVDLGLPSGTLWANKNVGASSETDNGILFTEVSLLLTLNIVGAGGLEPPKINYPI